MAIDALLEQTPCENLDHVLVNYPVPIKESDAKRDMKAINWPKGFVIPGLWPDGQGAPKAWLLSSLAKRPVPKGVESKYAHTIDFFEAVYTKQREKFEGSQKSELVEIGDQLSGPSWSGNSRSTT